MYPAPSEIFPSHPASNIPLLPFQAKHFIVDILQTKVLFFPTEIAFCDRAENLLDVADREDALIVVDKNQEQDVLLGILFLDGRRQEIVFGNSC